MTDSRPLPRFTGRLSDFVQDLRVRVFSSQQKAADYFLIIRSNISRYEDGTYTAPVLYMTELARLYAEHRHADAEVHQALLDEVNQTIIATFESERPYLNWDDLAATGRRYIEKQKTDRLSTKQSGKRKGVEWSHFGEPSPDLSSFLGREQERDLIKSWLTNGRCRIVGIVGLGGMGKTLLAKQVAVEIADSFQHIIWYSLRSRPTLAEVIKNCLCIWGQDTQLTEATDISHHISQLVESLCQRKCLLVLDNFESVFQQSVQVGTYLPGYEDYGRLLRVLSEVDLSSSILLTGREKPRELATTTGDGPVQTLEIEGIDVRLAQNILLARNLHGSATEWERLVHMCSGNPWILKITSETIQEMHNNHVGKFLERASGRLALDAHLFLDEQLRRISELERLLLVALAIEQEPMNAQMLAATIDNNYSEQQIDSALLSLRRRSLVEARDDRFTLPNVIFHDLIEQIVEQLFIEVTDRRLNLFKNHPILMARSAEYIRQAQIRLFFEPLIARLINRFHRLRYLEDHLLLLLNDLHQSPPHERGFAGVNLLHLLIQLNADLSRFSFAGMSLRFACVQNYELRDVNFIAADLSHAHFLDIFEPILSIAYSSDGRFLATGATNGEIRLWDVRTKAHLVTLHKHTDWVRNLVFNRIDGFLYSGGDDGAIYKWNLRTGQHSAIIGNFGGRVIALAISPDGQLMAVGGEDQVLYLWHIQDRTLIRKFTPSHSNWIRCTAFSPDGRHLVSASSDGSIRLWDVESGEHLRTLAGHNTYVMQVAFHPNGQTIVSSDFAGVVCFWDVSDGSCLSRYHTGNRSVPVLAFDPNGSILASGTMGGELLVWDGNSHTLITRFKITDYPVNAIAFEPGGSEMTVGYEDRTLNFIRTDTFQLTTRLAGHSSALYSVACAPNNPAIIAGGGENSVVTLWNLENGVPMQVLEGHTYRVFYMTFRADGEKLLTSSYDRTLRIWDVKGGYCEQVLAGHKAEIRAACWVGDEQIISTSPDLSIRIWDARTGLQVETLHGAFDELYAMAVTPDFQLLAAGGEDHKIWLWDLRTRQVLGEIPGHRGTIWALHFISKGRTLISCSSDGTVRYWDMETQKEMRTIHADSDQVKTIALNRSGTLLASAGYDRTVKLWDVESGDLLGSMTGHSGTIYSLGFTADDQAVVSASHDGTLRVWDVQSKNCSKILRPDRPYERMNITDVVGISRSQQNSLRQLGANTGVESAKRA